MLEQFIRYVEDVGQALLPTESDRRLLATRSIGFIRARTERGVDSEGAPFEQYSNDRPFYKRHVKYASYAAYKLALHGTTTVTLMESGAMLGAVRPSDESAVDEFAFGIYDDEKLAIIGHAHNEGAMTGRNHATRLPRRHWFDLNEDDMDQLGGIFEDLAFARITAL